MFLIYFDLKFFTENELLKCDIDNIREQNYVFENELLELRKLFKENQLTHCVDNDLYKKINLLIEDLNGNVMELHKNKKEILMNNIDNLSKLQKTNEKLNAMEQKVAFSDKWLDHKNEYVFLLLEYIENLKTNQLSMQLSFEDEIKSQNELISVIKSENVRLITQNRQHLTKQSSLSNDLKVVTENYCNLQNDHKNLQNEHNSMKEKFYLEKESFLSEINNLNQLLKQSKNQIVDQFLEKYYPNLSSITQMFDKKLSVSELYSLYLENRKKCDDLQIEKTVLLERVSSLDNEVDNMKYIIDKTNKQIISLQDVESKVHQLEHDQKEQNISLSFYQESANNLYKGVKMFNENFVDLSNEIRRLAQQETDLVSDESTSVLTLKFIEKLQNEIQKFKKLQNDFETKKLNFINLKQNLIAHDNQLEQLQNQVSLLETEKRQLLMQHTTIKNELESAQSYCKRIAQDSEIAITDLKRVNSDLSKQVSQFSDENKLKNSNMETVNKKNECLENEIGELKSKQVALNKELEFVKERLSLQQTLAEQFNKSLSQQRSKNENLCVINEQLKSNVQMLENKNVILNKLIGELESKVIGLEFSNDTLLKKQSILMDRLKSSHFESMSLENLDYLLNTFQESSTSIKEISLKNFSALKFEHDKLNELFKFNEKNWNEERAKLENIIEELKTRLETEANQVEKLRNEYYQLHQVRSQVKVDEDISVDQLLKSENDTFRSQLNSLTTHSSELATELTTTKQKLINLNQENLQLIQLKNQLENDICTFRAQNNSISSELEVSLLEKNSMITNLESKLSKLQAQNCSLIDKQNSELIESQHACQLYLNQIETLNQTLSDLRSELDLSNANGKLYSNQLEINKNILQKVQLDYERLLIEQKQKENDFSDLRKRFDQLQARYAENELNRLRSEEIFNSKKTSFDAEKGELIKENDLLKRKYLDAHQRNKVLFENIDALTVKLTDKDWISDQSKLVELNEFKSIVECLTLENDSLKAEYSTLISKESRHQAKINNLSENVSFLEKCLEKERDCVKNLKKLLDSDTKSEQIRFLNESLQSLRNSKIEIERKCSLYQIKAEQLEKEANSKDNQLLSKVRFV